MGVRRFRNKKQKKRKIYGWKLAQKSPIRSIALGQKTNLCGFKRYKEEGGSCRSGSEGMEKGKIIKNDPESAFRVSWTMKRNIGDRIEGEMSFRGEGARELLRTVLQLWESDEGK